MTLDPRHPEIEGLWRAVDAAGARSIAAVSARPGEGASTLAQALWRRAALAGRSALLVELNPERPGLAARFGAPAAGGIRLGGEPGLGLLEDPGAAALDAWRDPAALRAAVAGWLRHWDRVVLDGAPLVARGAQRLPGATAAAAAEATLLVVLSGRTPAAAVREAREVLAGAGATLLGTVLNDRDSPSLLSELEREARRLGRIAPGLARRAAAALHRSALLGIRV